MMKQEYTDRKNIGHAVIHRILPEAEPDRRERIRDEIREILLRQKKRMTASEPEHKKGEGACPL